MKHLPTLCAACLACLLLLPSCKFYSLTTHTSNYVDAALSGGEAKYADYTLHAWSLSSNEILELRNEKGDTLYLLPISMSAKVELPPLLSYNRIDFVSPHTVWDFGTMKFHKPFATKKLYVPLKLKPQAQAARQLRRYGIHQKGLEFTADQDLKSYRQHGAKLPNRWQLRRIAIPGLERMIRKDLILYGRAYVTERSLLASAFASGAYICIDLPLGITGFVLASLYESTLGHIF